MSLVEYTLNSKKQKKVQIDIFPLATMLWNEFEQNGVLDRMKAVPQLGAIRVNSHQRKSRYDYVMLQLYLHQITKAALKDDMLFTYHHSIQSDGFCNNSESGAKKGNECVNNNQPVSQLISNRRKSPLHITDKKTKNPIYFYAFIW